MTPCRTCGAPFGPTETMTVPLRALPSVMVTGVEGQRCTSCDNVRYQVQDLDGLFRMVAFMLVHKPERLSGPEARFLRKWLGWSGQDTAERLGFSPEHVSRWENGKVRMSDTADRLLRVLATRLEPIDDYAALDKLLLRDADSSDEAEASAPRLTHNDGEWIAA